LQCAKKMENSTIFASVIISHLLVSLGTSTNLTFEFESTSENNLQKSLSLKNKGLLKKYKAESVIASITLPPLI
jgi:hypothetical protein